MVSDCIEVETKSVDSEKGYKWISTGAEGYSIEECDKKDNGTKISLHIKEDTEEDNYSDYLEEYNLKELIKKYSDYIRYPIKMEVTKHELIDEEKHEYDDIYLLEKEKNQVFYTISMNFIMLLVILL